MGEEPDPEGQAAFESPFFCVEPGESPLLYAGRSARASWLLCAAAFSPAGRGAVAEYRKWGEPFSMWGRYACFSRHSVQALFAPAGGRNPGAPQSP